MKVYKITDKDGKTFGNTQWGAGVEHTAPGGGPLCTDRWLYAYRSPAVAMMMKPLHADYDLFTLLLWECDADVGVDALTQLGCTRVRTLRTVPRPDEASEGYATAAITAGMACYYSPSWRQWAEAWLSGADRSAAAARREEDKAFGVWCEEKEVAYCRVDLLLLSAEITLDWPIAASRRIKAHRASEIAWLAGRAAASARWHAEETLQRAAKNKAGNP